MPDHSPLFTARDLLALRTQAVAEIDRRQGWYLLRSAVLERQRTMKDDELLDNKPAAWAYRA
jgi:hypothetical protein